MADPDDGDMDAMKKEKLRAYEASLGGFELKAFEALEREFQEVCLMNKKLSQIHFVFMCNFLSDLKNLGLWRNCHFLRFHVSLFLLL